MKASISRALLLATLPILLTAFADRASAQPSQAEMKNRLTNPGVMSVTIHGPGKREWSSTFKKYVWNVSYTVKRKTDQPGVFLSVQGYSSYDIVGGRFIHWRDFTSGNSYDGIKPPSLADINNAIQATELRRIAGSDQVGEYISLKLAPDPDWEWHTPKSVSFTVIMVFKKKNSGGSYGGEPQFQPVSDMAAVDTIEAHRRFRLYRDGPDTPWDGLGVSPSVPLPGSKHTNRRVERLLSRELVPYQASRTLAGPARHPVITQ
jgi:hypothetical protein